MREERYLRRCDVCGVDHRAAFCNRMIDIRDGSIWPAVDTGFRWVPEDFLKSPIDIISDHR